MEDFVRVLSLIFNHTLDEYAKVGQILSGIGFCVTALVACVTYFSYHRKSMYVLWIDSFRILYAEFWKDPRIARVRRWIVSDEEYEMIKEVLIRRLDMPKENNKLSADENKILEDIDYFFALIGRIEFTRRTSKGKAQKLLWDATYGSFWIDKIKGKKELRDYAKRYWDVIVGPLLND